MRWSKIIIAIGIVTIAGIASFYFQTDNFRNWVEKRNVVNAIKFSLSLEEQAVQKPPFESVEELESFFRQGFGGGFKRADTIVNLYIVSTEADRKN